MQNFLNALQTFWNTAGYLRFNDVLDILIVVLFVYALIMLLKRTHSFFIFGGMLILFGVYILARMLNLYLTSLIFQAFFAFFVVIFVIIFQRELRHFFEWLLLWGRMSWQKRETFSEFLSGQIIQAIHQMMSRRMGALIVLAGEDPIDRFLEGGIALDGKISSSLILSIFDASSPGHDGAVVIDGGRIKKFGVHLPLAERFKQFEKMGTRHRAALGLAERSDALVIVVSEERGVVSLAQHGEIRELADADDLQEIIAKFFKEEVFRVEPRLWYSVFIKNWKEKILAVVIALALWFIFVVQLGMGAITRQYSIPVELRGLPQDFVIGQISPKEISLTLSGRMQDFNLLNKDLLKVTVPTVDISVASEKIKITEDMISAPPELSIVNFTPKIIQLSLKKKPEKQEEESQ